MTTVLLYVALPGAAMILGALLGAMLTRGIDRGHVTPVDDRPFIPELRAVHAEKLFSAGDETDIVQAVRLSDGRPTPGPKLRSVP